MAKLTDKQRRFALEYLQDLNATQAAIRAGYSPKHADVNGPRLLGNAGIREFVDAALAKRAYRLELSADRVLAELMRVGLVDLGRAFDDRGRLFALQDMPEDVRRAISAVEIEEDYGPTANGTLDDGAPAPVVAVGRVAKVKFWDKPKALELLGKHLKLFAERVEHSGPDGGPIEFRDGLTDDERAARIATLLERAGSRGSGRDPVGAEAVGAAPGPTDRGASKPS